eukprot:SAG31_NODE_1725_length_7439_cov_7.440037_4_plen_187_part_00
MDVGRSANGTVQLPAGHTLILLAAVASSVNLHKDGAADASIRYGDPVAAVVQTLRAARRQLSKTIHYAQTANHHMWQRYWQKSSISLPNSPLIERYWWSSLYLLRLAAGGSTPPGLYGPFITQDDCEWAGDLHLNYNYQVSSDRNTLQLSTSALTLSRTLLFVSEQPVFSLRHASTSLRHGCAVFF